MSCVTCRDVTLPTNHTLTDGWTPGPIPPKRHGPGHVGHRLGDTIPGTVAVTWRGHDVSLQCVEAYADGTDGWVEMRVVNNDGDPTMHPAKYVCPSCGIERHKDAHGDQVEPQDFGCPGCSSLGDLVLAHPAHVQTVIRAGQVTIIHGTHITTGTETPAS